MKEMSYEKHEISLKSSWHGQMTRGTTQWCSQTSPPNGVAKQHCQMTCPYPNAILNHHHAAIYKCLYNTPTISCSSPRQQGVIDCSFLFRTRTIQEQKAKHTNGAYNEPWSTWHAQNVHSQHQDGFQNQRIPAPLDALTLNWSYQMMVELIPCHHCLCCSYYHHYYLNVNCPMVCTSAFLQATAASSSISTDDNIKQTNSTNDIAPSPARGFLLLPPWAVEKKLGQ